VAARLAVVVIALLAALGLPWIYQRGLGGAALYDGDEAIYAQMAREMVQARRPSELSFDGELLFPRPPGAVWPIAALYALIGDAPPEPAVRAVNAGACAVAVALTILLGARAFGPLVGLTAGGLLATADLFVGYARVYESEPVLLCCILLAFYGWALRSRAGWALYGLGFGLALLTKQAVSLLPLLAPLVDRLAARRRGEPPPSLRGPLTGVAIAVIVAVPWHVLMVVRHGRTFLRSYLLNSVIGRGGGALLRRTPPWFYLRELVVSEGAVFAALLLAAAVSAAIVGRRRGRAFELLLGAWALLVLAIYSAARSRYDYYLLLAYPALALAAAWAIAALPLGRARVALATALVALSAFLHLPRNLTAQSGDDEARALLSATRNSAPGAIVYTLGRQPFSARVYSDHPVHVFVESERDFEAAVLLRASGMPAPTVLAVPARAAIAIAVRPAFLLYPRARTDVLDGVSADRYRLVGESKRLRLLYLP
jgi:4-amino-4-deoxy-L-arabinose transferase-like glycosyltransferase